MSAAMGPLKDVAWFQDFIMNAKNPVLGILVGAGAVCRDPVLLCGCWYFAGTGHAGPYAAVLCIVPDLRH